MNSYLIDLHRHKDKLFYELNLFAHQLRWCKSFFSKARWRIYHCILRNYTVVITIISIMILAVIIHKKGRNRDKKEWKIKDCTSSNLAAVTLSVCLKNRFKIPSKWLGRSSLLSCLSPLIIKFFRRSLASITSIRPVFFLTALMNSPPSLTCLSRVLIWSWRLDMMSENKGREKNSIFAKSSFFHLCDCQGLICFFKEWLVPWSPSFYPFLAKLHRDIIIARREAPRK